MHLEEPKPMSDFEFPNCMHQMSAALHMQRIDPASVTITMPREDWWRLWCVLDSKYRNLMTFDGRGAVPESFRYMGFTFKPTA